MTMKLGAIVGATLLSLSAAMMSTAAVAASITISSTTPTWGPVVGGTGVVLNGVNGSFIDVRWGTPAGGSGKSGLGFDPANPPSAVVLTDTLFNLGTLRHYNNPIAGGTAAASAQLSLATTIASAVPATQTFSFNFLIDETANVTPCAYPSTTPCADRITFQNLDTTSAFVSGGVAYTIALSGFSTDGGTTISSFFDSQEGSTNSAGLYGKIIAPTPVPEPASMMLLGAGLLGLGLARRRRT